VIAMIAIGSEHSGSCGSGSAKPTVMLPMVYQEAV
jgi:hypothetical protein